MGKEFDLSMCRVQVDKEEQAKQLQEYAFAQGFYWRLYGKITGSKPKDLDYPYYYFDSRDNSITYCNNDFNNGEYKEIHFTDVFKETLQEKEQRLLEELEEVRKEIEDSEIKVGNWVVVKETKEIFKVDEVDIEYLESYHEKITNPELIKLLEQEIK